MDEKVDVNSLREGSCPCYGCQKRVLGCHSMCKEYKDWVTSRMILQEKWRKEHGGASEARVFEVQSKTKLKADNHRRRRK